MKGISQFASAIAAATFIPGVVEIAGAQQSMILLLAGVFGLMPDWLDFIEVSFFRWRRRWTHSLVLGAAFGLAAGLAFSPLAGWVTAVAYWTHLLADQLGYLGSNLFWPFAERRTAGLKLLHSGDPLPNFLVVWSSAMLILYNLNRFAPRPQFDGNVFLLWAVFLPAAAMIGALAYGARAKQRTRAEAEPGREALAEVEETQV